MTSEPDEPRGTKAGRNEQRKIAATFRNNAAVALVLAAFLQPALAVMQGARTITLVEGLGSLILVSAAFVLYRSAKRSAGLLED